MKSKFEAAKELIDEANALDPNKVLVEGKDMPKELLYSQRMTEVLATVDTNPSEELQIAIRAQHIRRWAIQRKEYPMDRKGYHRWRNDQKEMHAKVVGEVLEQVGYDEVFIERVAFLISKKEIKKDAETQTLEDVACLVFLQYYMKDFIVKHSDEKVVGIIQKTWKKMSERGHESARKIEYSERGTELIKKALQ